MTNQHADISDISLCDREPIHIPESIQPHGVLIALDRHTHRVMRISENLAQLAGIDAASSLGKSLADALGTETASWVSEQLEKENIEARPHYLGAHTLADKRCFDVLAHAQGDALVIEFEPCEVKTSDFRHFYPLVSKFVGALNDAGNIRDMSELAVREIKTITKFGRVLLYRFDQQQHGEVLAEAVDDGYHSYLNQHFPASDIPQQARTLYVANRVRLIANANYTPARLLALPEYAGTPFDLTHSTLRSVSPVHVEYMKNMGTLASMSISIVIRGKLWGLISCHDKDARSVSFELRAICEQLGQILAIHFEAAEERIEFNHRLELRGTLVTMLAALSQSNDFSSNLANVSHDLLRFANASGAALIMNDAVVAFGVTPSKADIQRIADWLQQKGVTDVYCNDTLSSTFPEAENFKNNASGIMALSISQIHSHYLIWFRPEVIHTIDWAGNPYEKLVASNMATTLSPRRSFEVWRETVHGASKPWRQSEIDTALEFRTAILGIVLERAEEMAELAEHLGRANKELESFSYSVSHDLRSPLRHIAGFADLLLEMESDRLSERGLHFIENIKSSAHFAGKLVDDLLSFSQMGRSALRISSIDMNELVTGTIARLDKESAGRKITWHVSQLPAIDGDPTFIELAVWNLLSNALKYTKERDEAIIDIDVEETESHATFYIRDNGVGFDPNYVHKLFGVFQRLHRMEDYEGTGIGLANVKRIIERHGGTVAANGVLGKGATFSFTIAKKFQTDEIS